MAELKSDPVSAFYACRPVHTRATEHRPRGRADCPRLPTSASSRRTIYTWRRLPAFRRAVDERGHEALGVVVVVVVVRMRNLMLRATP